MISAEFWLSMMFRGLDDVTIVHLDNTPLFNTLFIITMTMDSYESIVIGAGPGGLSTVAALVDSGIQKIFWIDRDFKGGRFNTMYREISS
jgi:hypothetical protein